MRRIAAVACLTLAVAGCSSSGSGTTPTPSDSVPSSGSSVAATIAPSALKAKLASLTSLTSATVSATTDVSGQKITGTGAARLADGAILAGDLTQSLPGGLGDIRIVRVAGKTYAKLPAGLTRTSKPWLLLSANSSNPVVSQLKSVVDTVLAVASPSSLVAFTNAASSIEDRGGSPRHYSLAVDATKLPPELASGLGRTGTIPVELYLDAQNRPVQISGTFSLSGTPITPTIMLSSFNQPVSIVAPPATQVGSK